MKIDENELFMALAKQNLANADELTIFRSVSNYLHILQQKREITDFSSNLAQTPCGQILMISVLDRLNRVLKFHINVWELTPETGLLYGIHCV